MSIAISAVMPPTAVAGQAELALQAGAVVDARVVQVTAEGMARIAIANTLIDVMAAAPLAAGDVLRLAVAQTGEGVKLTIVSQTPSGAAPEPVAGIRAPQSPAEQVPASRVTPPGNSRADTPLPAASEPPAPAPRATAVAQLVRDNVARQASLAPLFANLAKAVERGDLPQQLRASAAQLLAMRPVLSENLAADDLRAAVARAGPFPEAPAQAASQSPTMPELKAALVVFRQVLAAWLAETDGGTPRPQSVTAAFQPASQPAAPAQAPSVPVAPVATGFPAEPALPHSPASPVANPPAGPATMAGPQGTAVSLMPAQPQPGLAATVSSGVDQMATAAAAIGATGKAAADALQQGAPLQTSAQLQLRQLSGGALLALLQEVQQEGREFARVTAEGKAGALDPLARLIRAGTGAEKQAVSPATSAEAIRANLPPPLPGGLPTPQPVAATGLDDGMSLADVGRRLLDDADGAIARQTLLQIASLPQGADAAARTDAAASRWNFEIPFATPQGTAVAQFEISRDGGRAAREDARPVWQARFTISIEPVGPVHAQILLSGDRTSVRLWAERPESAAALREGTQNLSRALKEADLVPGDILVGEGAPTPAQAGAAVRAGRYLDRAT